MRFSAAAAWSVKYDYFYVHLDYLKPVLGDQLPVYISLGGALGFGKDMAVTARVPLGISYLFRGPFDVFFEVVPGLDHTPETDFDVMEPEVFTFTFSAQAPFRHTTFRLPVPLRAGDFRWEEQGRVAI